MILLPRSLTSPCFQDILSRTREGQELHWFKTLHEYYNRPEWELFDLKHDPMEMYNVAKKPSYQVNYISSSVHSSNYS